MTSDLAPLVGRTRSERDVFRHRPVIVLAPARSNSSVVTAMIGRHPALYGLPELCLFSHPTLGDRLNLAPVVGDPPPGWNPVAGIQRAVAEIVFGGQGDLQMGQALDWLWDRALLSGAEVMDELLERLAPLVGVEKSPETVFGTEQLNRAASSYPRARFIHLVRHPVSTIRSVLAHESLLATPEIAARSWMWRHEMIRDFLGTLGSGDGLTIRSEDALNDPAAAMARVADWLGLSRSPECVSEMCHPERSPFATGGVAGDLGGADRGFLLSPEIKGAELPALSELADLGLAPSLCDDLAKLATELGYPD